MTDNHIQLNGRLGQDPKVFEKNGNQYTRLSVATAETFKDEKTDKEIALTTWHDVLLFMPHVIAMADGFKKGDKVHVTGKLVYKTVKSESGFNIKQATIIASLVSKRT